MWEYVTVLCEEQQGGTYHATTQGHMHVGSLDEILNEFGRLAWELVNCYPSRWDTPTSAVKPGFDVTAVTAVFKRPVQDAQTSRPPVDVFQADSTGA